MAHTTDHGIVHDAEYYILDAQHGERWAVEDGDLDNKLAELQTKFGSPPNIIHLMWDDTPVGDVGVPFIQKQRGWETPNINRLAAEGINFTRMYSEPSCTPSRGAVITGRHPIRNGMYNVSFPYEFGGLSDTEVTTAEVLSDAGYATAFYGKWHLGDVESSYCTNHGFDEALWLPYNQVPSLWNDGAQASALTPAVLYPEMYPDDPYDMDPGWRPKGFVFALEGTKGGPVNEWGRAPSHAEYMKLDPEFKRRTLAFIEKNAAAKKPFYCAFWPLALSFMGGGWGAERVTPNGALIPEALARFDVFVGQLMDKLKELGIAENTLLVIMADNGPMVHHGPAGSGFIETLYRGGKGDYLEGGVRVPAMAWWPGVIESGQIVGDIIHETDLFTTFARLAGATEHIPTDRIIDGLDQTALLLNGDTHSRRDYVFIYTGDILAATVKGRYKRAWIGDHPGLPGAAFYDLYSDPREMSGQLIPMLSAKSMFNMMRTRHELFMEQYPNSPEERAWPLTGIENARPETKAAGRPRVDFSILPIDPIKMLEHQRGWEGMDMDRAE
ncbi:MAG: sulfatase-like hydrolase/transferase [Nocardioidaceae bacterium]